MNLTQIKASGYKIFSHQKPENKEKNIVAVQYIEQLASQCGTNTAAWDIFALFGDTEARSDHHLISDKNAINKIFFETEIKYRENVTEAMNAIRDTVIARTAEAWENRRRSKLSQLNGERERNLERAANRLDEHNSYLRAAYNNSIELDKLNDQSASNTYAEKVLLVLKDSFWELHDVSSDAVRFKTKAEVVMSECNPAAGVDYSVNLGHYVVTWYFFGGNLRLEPLVTFKTEYAGNLGIDGYFHPYVDSRGKICFGDAGNRATDAMKAGDLPELMRIIASLITTYANSTPYVRLGSFRELDAKRTGRSVPASIDSEPGLFDDEDSDRRRGILRADVSIDSTMHVTEAMYRLADAARPSSLNMEMLESAAAQLRSNAVGYHSAFARAITTGDGGTMMTFHAIDGEHVVDRPDVPSVMTYTRELEERASDLEREV